MAGVWGVMNMRTMHRFIILLVVAILAFAGVAFAQEPAPAQSSEPPSTQTTVKNDRGDKPAKKARAKRQVRRLNPAGCYIRAPWMCRRAGKTVVVPRKMGWHLNKKKFGVRHWKALDTLWGKRESGWQPFEPGAWGKVPLMNKAGSGACGIPQALPCKKIPNPRSVKSQIMWGLRYIAQRYGHPIRALRERLAKGWY